MVRFKGKIRQSAQLLAAAIPMLLAILMFPVAAHADTGVHPHVAMDSIDYPMPTADRPAVYDGGPVSIPVKALVQRLASRGRKVSLQASRFRYDIDTLGQGVAVRVHFKF